jgi:hypothetical protein
MSICIVRPYSKHMNSFKIAIRLPEAGRTVGFYTLLAGPVQQNHVRVYAAYDTKTLYSSTCEHNQTATL